MPYKDPEKEKEHQRLYYQQHKEKIKKLTRAWAINNPEKMLEAGRKYRRIHREEYNKRSRERVKANPEAYRRANQKYQMALRLEVLTAYAGNPPKCACCREGHIEFLAIDHIGGGGNTHRKQIGIGWGRLYLWLKRQGYPSDFRVLCHNCNMSFGFYGYCPHQIVEKKLPPDTNFKEA